MRLAPDLVLVGLGGNLGTAPEITQRFGAVAEALTELGEVRRSALYRTAPVGPAQPSFLNAVVAVRLVASAEGGARAWPPPRLMTRLLTLEAQWGRVRDSDNQWGPRTLDLDLLLWGHAVGTWDGPPAVTLPHPRLRQRRFVLTPLLDVLAPAQVVPGAAQTLAAAAQAVASQALTRVASAW